jgi:hypothetical protein
MGAMARSCGDRSGITGLQNAGYLSQRVQIPTTWVLIAVFGGGQGTLVQGGGRFGPVFVNPYDSDVLYALATDRIRVGMFINGAWSLRDDFVLTSLVSEGWRFPFVPTYSSNSTDVDSSHDMGGAAWERSRTWLGIATTFARHGGIAVHWSIREARRR